MRPALVALRELMEARGLSAWVVPSADPHQSEYVAPRWQRRAFASGFDGSAGTLVVTAGEAGLWADSRYWIQAEQQLEGSGIDLYRVGDEGVPSWQDWLAEHTGEGDRVGANPMVLSDKDFGELADKLGDAELVAEPDDLVDRVWGDDRPERPATPLRVHRHEHSGSTVTEKLERVAGVLDGEADALLVCALDELAWLFDLRGSDVAYNPVFLGWGLVTAEGATLLTDLSRVPDQVRAALPEQVALRPYGDIEDLLRGLGGRRVWIDPSTTAHRLAWILEEAGAELVRRTGPIPRWKAAKNDVELAGMRAAHVRDGVAMVRFLRWLEQAVPGGEVTELSAEAHLEELRGLGEHFVGPSFRTIAGYGPHGAIVHYASTPDSDVTLRPEGLFLVDSGGQYLDGTTDITRTVALGEPTAEQRRAYTAVLRGHLHLGRATFRSGTDGYQLDVLARAPLWEEGLGYGHGTGHGVGAALSVHEGPFRVSNRPNATPLEPGNVLSNEPGFYLADAWGIRVENVVVVVERMSNDQGTFLGFEDLTLCPYDRRLVDVDALSPRERAQVDAYHARVREILSPLLDGADREWLVRATRPL